jgi:peptidase M28-like protein
MKSDSNPGTRRRGWGQFSRFLVYSLLIVWVADYFFIHPSKTTHSQLLSPPPELIDLASRLSEHVHYLASPALKGRRFGTPGNKAAEKYILDRFIELGLSAPGPDKNRTQLVSSSIGSNVFSALTPIIPNRKWLIFGAHFDHLGEEDGELFLGADDNASGVAILLETARLLQQASTLNQYNILFISFNSEEPPNFLTRWMGSNHFMAKSWEAGIEEVDIQMAIIMDLMGGVFWNPLQETVFATGTEKTPVLESLLSKIQVPGLDIRPLGLHMVETIPSQGLTPFSDYDVFRNEEIPFLFLSSGRTPNYHRPTDTAEKLYYPRMARTVLWLEKFIRSVDRLKEPVIFDPDRQNFIEDYKSIQPLVQEASTWSGRIPGTSLITLFDIKQDRDRLQEIETKIKNQKTLSPYDAYALSQASIRLQCLLGNMGPCFLMPDADNYDDEYDEDFEEDEDE